MKSRLTLICSACALLSACITPQYNYRVDSKRISFPELGKVVTSNVGDEMLNQGVYTEMESLKVNSEIILGIFSNYSLQQGYYDKQGEDRNNEFYMPAQGLGAGMVNRSALADHWKCVIYTKDGREIGIITIFNEAIKENARDVQRIKRPILSENSFQQTLLYSGKVGNKVKVGYREFSGPQARPAFSNDVDYDLDVSKVIGYKGARIEIIDATNESITYKVIQNFRPTDK